MPDKFLAASTFRRAPINSPDLYRTPRGAIEPLLDAEPIIGSVWEPACGDGALARVLIERGIPVWATDLYDHGYGDTGIDFLTSTTGAATILTNPPFNRNQVEKFAVHGLELAHKVILLGRLTILESGRRYSFFQQHPPRRVWVFSDRVPFTTVQMEHTRQNCRLVAFAWYVWERGFTGKPELGWLRYEEKGFA
jgi:hypothetical protein